MNRPAAIWILFSICLAVLLAAIGSVTKTVVRLDRANTNAQLQAEREERIRLALWRMDSWLAPLIVEESARPHYAYASFHSPDRAYTKMYSSVNQEILVPSPLLGFSSTNTLIHFQVDPNGRMTSPQIPDDRERSLALRSYTSASQIELAAKRLLQLQGILNSEPENASIGPVAITNQATPAEPITNNRDLLFAVCAPPTRGTNQTPSITVVPLPFDFTMPNSPAEIPAARNQTFRNSIEQNARVNIYKQAVTEKSSPDSSPGSQVEQGPLQPVWIGPALILARRVEAHGQSLIQGCWLEWTNLQQVLLEGVHDLFPDATLHPVRAANAIPSQSQLAFLPVRLEVPALEPAVVSRWTPIQLSLAVAWGCVLVAALAVGLLLHGAVSLSERRGAFVSAVTHELRTPLTTFKIYSEMLADGMVPDPVKQRGYLTTLCAEANRLTHLVENVLAYARLERDELRLEPIGVQELINRIRPRLEQRAEQCQAQLAVRLPDAAAVAEVNVNVTAVEQILFNLVDNACKYSALNSDETGNAAQIELTAEPVGTNVAIRVRDHGPGLKQRAAKNLFRPFRKSAHEAADTAPGIGLGLALSRRLSREMHGDLQFDNTVRDGACFVLLLPLPPVGRPAFSRSPSATNSSSAPRTG